MDWVRLGMEVASGYKAVSDWRKPDLGLRISYSREAGQIVLKKCDGQRRRRRGAELLLE